MNNWKDIRNARRPVYKIRNGWAWFFAGIGTWAIMSLLGYWAWRAF